MVSCLQDALPQKRAAQRPLILLPVSALALALALKVLPESCDPQGRRLDMRGQTLAIAALCALTLAAIE
ncbi:MAG TPA: hypothetical protein VGL83_19510, partial [Stellaceae bacterium]